MAPGTISLRLGAVRLAYEAANSGYSIRISPPPLRRVSGVKKLGVRLGNWLTEEQCQRLWHSASVDNLKGKRDRALLAVLLACVLRRHEADDLEFGHIQQREEHRAVVDLRGKAGHTRTVPVPGWVKGVLDDWIEAAGLTSGKLFRRVNRNGKAWGTGLTERQYGTSSVIMRGKLTSRSLRLTIYVEHAHVFATPQVANWSRSNSFWAHVSIQTTERCSAANSGSVVV